KPLLQPISGLRMRLLPNLLLGSSRSPDLSEEPSAVVLSRDQHRLLSWNCEPERSLRWRHLARRAIRTVRLRAEESPQLRSDYSKRSRAAVAQRSWSVVSGQLLGPLS